MHVLQNILARKDAEHERITDALKGELAVTKADLSSTRQQLAASQDELAIAQCSASEADATIRVALHESRSERDSATARLSGASDAYSRLEVAHLQLTADHSRAQLQLVALEQKLLEGHAEWTVQTDTLKGRLFALQVRLDGTSIQIALCLFHKIDVRGANSQHYSQTNANRWITQRPHCKATRSHG